MNRRNWLLGSIGSFFGIPIAFGGGCSVTNGSNRPTQYNNEEDYLYLPKYTKDIVYFGQNNWFVGLRANGNETKFVFVFGKIIYSKICGGCSHSHRLEVIKHFPSERYKIYLKARDETDEHSFGRNMFYLKEGRYDEIPFGYREIIKEITLKFKPWMKSLEVEIHPLNPVEIKEYLKDFKYEPNPVGPKIQS